MTRRAIAQLDAAYVNAPRHRRATVSPQALQPCEMTRGEQHEDHAYEWTRGIKDVNPNQLWTQASHLRRRIEHSHDRRNRNAE